MKKILILRLVGGLGNQIFMVANALSLSIEYNLKLIIDSKCYDPSRPNVMSYKIFKKLPIQSEINPDYFNSDLNNLITIKQNSFKYEKILLDTNNYNSIGKNIVYLLDKNQSGYFQSYKFFNHNLEYIKSNLNINFKLINNFKQKLNSIGSHICIHFRLTDYLVKNDYHQVVDINYYLQILFKYNLETHKIILFSDDIKLAMSMLKKFIDPNIIILANDITSNDEEQLLLMACTSIRICPNSSYSLWSCYLNDMYGFNPNSIYYFPSKWFGSSGIKDYNIYDLIPKVKSKFKVIKV